MEDYNRKVEFVKNVETATGSLNVPQLNTSIFTEDVNETKSEDPVTVNTNVTKLTDREIALSYFLTLKRAGKEYAIASMEVTNPHLRQFLKDAYTMSCNHSYEVYEWMAKKIIILLLLQLLNKLVILLVFTRLSHPINFIDMVNM